MLNVGDIRIISFSLLKLSYTPFHSYNQSRKCLSWDERKFLNSLAAVRGKFQKILILWQESFSAKCSMGGSRLDTLLVSSLSTNSSGIKKVKNFVMVNKKYLRGIKMESNLKISWLDNPIFKFIIKWLAKIETFSSWIIYRVSDKHDALQ